MSVPVRATLSVAIGFVLMFLLLQGTGAIGVVAGFLLMFGAWTVLPGKPEDKS